MKLKTLLCAVSCTALLTLNSRPAVAETAAGGTVKTDPGGTAKTAGGATKADPSGATKADPGEAAKTDQGGAAKTDQGGAAKTDDGGTAKTAGGTVKTDPGEAAKTGAGLLVIPGGEFEMGSTTWDESPLHKVTVKKFSLGRAEVTVGEFRAFVEATAYVTEAQRENWCWAYDPNGTWKDVKGASWLNPGFPQGDDHPVVCVSWNDATAYCGWAGCRLPTEEEWEYAAGNGQRHTLFGWGGELSPAPPAAPTANLADEAARKVHKLLQTHPGYDDGFASTAPVGSFPPNDFGLVDVTGNVLEWTAAWYTEGYDNGPATSGSMRVMRGGSWRHRPESSGTSRRVANEPSYRSAALGFRTARDVSAAAVK